MEKYQTASTTLGAINSAMSIGSKIWMALKSFHLGSKLKYRHDSHYFKEYHKHVTIYKNGSGIIINSFIIVFNNNRDRELKRAINIEDGKKCASFPSVKDMCSENISNRFSKYGLWYRSENNIVAGIEEKYWTNDICNEHANYKKNDKEIRWVMKFNYNNIEYGKPYKIEYVMSIPDMFPLVDGKISEEEINDMDYFINNGNMLSSSLKITHKVEKMLFTVSFDHGINVKPDPVCKYDENGKAQDESDGDDPRFKVDDGILYRKYLCKIKKPKLNSSIFFRWTVE